jgi:hypothetical protein
LNSQEELDATSKQRTRIAQLSLALGIPEALESGPLTMAQAGKQIRHLSDQLKLRRLKKSKPITDIFLKEFRRRIR